MPQNKLEDLKNHLFQCLEELNNPEEGQDMKATIQKSNAVASIAGQINNTYKLQLTAYKLADKMGYKTPNVAALIGATELQEPEQKSNT